LAEDLREADREAQPHPSTYPASPATLLKAVKVCLEDAVFPMDLSSLPSTSDYEFPSNLVKKSLKGFDNALLFFFM